jgi:hypothetical protein
MFYALYLTDPPPSLLLSDDTSIDNTTNNNNDDNVKNDLGNVKAINNDYDKVNKNKTSPPTW